MGDRNELLASIANTISDYRKGEIKAPDATHVNKWVSQFPEQVQLPILKEMDYVLKKSYFSEEDVKRFLRCVLNSRKLAGERPCAFWRRVNFLDIQLGGASQKEMLGVFNDSLVNKCNFGICECGDGDSIFLYLDDAIFSGNRILKDLSNWIREEAPSRAHVHVVTIASHSGGEYYADKNIRCECKKAGKEISISWWHAIKLENRKSYCRQADVLWPSMIPNDPDVQAYVAGLQYPPTLRPSGSRGSREIFSSEAGRNMLEQELLKAGVKIRKMCAKLGERQRPLGNTPLESLGFGSLIVTYRNCPNSAPLALWAGDPWYPLFPRKSNTQTAVEQLLKELFGDDCPF